MAAIIKTAEESEKMRIAGQLAADVLNMIDNLNDHLDNPSLSYIVMLVMDSLSLILFLDL